MRPRNLFGAVLLTYYYHSAVIDYDSNYNCHRRHAGARLVIARLKNMSSIGCKDTLYFIKTIMMCTSDASTVTSHIIFRCPFFQLVASAILSS